MSYARSTASWFLLKLMCICIMGTVLGGEFLFQRDKKAAAKQLAEHNDTKALVVVSRKKTYARAGKDVGIAVALSLVTSVGCAVVEDKLKRQRH